MGVKRFISKKTGELSDAKTIVGEMREDFERKGIIPAEV
jgi:hypothetical protein